MESVQVFLTFLVEFVNFKEKSLEILCFQLVLLICIIAGALYLFNKFYNLYKILRVSLKSLKNLSKLYGKGSWVVITGGSDGIGYGFAQELAKLGFNMVLIARNKKKLKDTAIFLAGRYKIEVITIQKDFTKTYESDFYDEIMEKISHLDVSILVNNVGTAVGGGFMQKSDLEYEDMIFMNVFPIVFLTKKLIPKLLNRYDKTNRSAVINLASITGQYPQTCAEVYSGTKAFDDFFTRSLAFQFEKTNIDFLSVCPLAVSSPLTQHTKIHHAISPNQCAYGSLQWLGENYQTNGHWIHNLQRWGMQWVPEKILLRYVAKESQKFFDTINKKQ